MINVLILGKGFLGKGLLDYFDRCNRACYTDYTHKVDAKLLSKAELDYTSQFALNAHFTTDGRGAPDVVINTSGYTGKPNIDAAEYDKANCWKYNVVVPKTIHDLCYDWSVPMIHISSGCVYNGYEKEFTEDDVPNFGLYTDESSFYSKTKHAAETLMPHAHHFRIRMPFTHSDNPRNYFNKITGYSQLISMPNSMTCLEDLNEFIMNALPSVQNGTMRPGIFHIVNPGFVTAKKIIQMMMNDQQSLVGLPEFIPVEELKTKAKRSNCKLSTGKLEALGLALPPVEESLAKAIRGWSVERWYA